MWRNLGMVGSYYKSWCHTRVHWKALMALYSKWHIKFERLKPWKDVTRIVVNMYMWNAALVLNSKNAPNKMSSSSAITKGIICATTRPCGKLWLVERWWWVHVRHPSTNNNLPHRLVVAQVVYFVVTLGFFK